MSAEEALAGLADGDSDVKKPEDSGKPDKKTQKKNIEDNTTKMIEKQLAKKKKQKELEDTKKGASDEERRENLIAKIKIYKNDPDFGKELKANFTLTSAFLQKKSIEELETLLASIDNHLAKGDTSDMVEYVTKIALNVFENVATAKGYMISGSLDAITKQEQGLRLMKRIKLKYSGFSPKMDPLYEFMLLYGQTAFARHKTAKSFAASAGAPTVKLDKKIDVSMLDAPESVPSIVSTIQAGSAIAAGDAAVDPVSAMMSKSKFNNGPQSEPKPK